MKVSNFTNAAGNTVKNHSIITDDAGARSFQSYNSIIVKIDSDGQVFLDENTWDYSSTTSKHRNHFLGEDTKSTKAKIKDGTFILTDLNK